MLQLHYCYSSVTVEHLDDDLEVWVCGARAVGGRHPQLAAVGARVNGGAIARVWGAQVGAQCDCAFL